MAPRGRAMLRKRKEVCSESPQELYEHYIEVVTKLQFAFGDGPFPMPECTDYVYRCVRKQLLQTLHAIDQQKLARNRKGILDVPDVIHYFAAHKPLLTRLLLYAKALANAKMAERTKNAEEARLELQRQNENDESDGSTSEFESDLEEDKDREKNGAPRAKRGRVTELKYYDAYREIIVGFNKKGAFDTVLDEICEDPLGYGLRQRQADRVKDMNREDFFDFADARQSAFFAPTRFKTAIMAARFRAWLDLPEEVSHSVLFVLGFIARETAWTLTDGAQLMSAKEWDKRMERHGPKDSLQLRHYEESARRNPIFRRCGDFLFDSKASTSKDSASTS